MSNYSKALVTGADGLLGSNLVRNLLERGVEVRALIQPGVDSPTLDGLDIERRECDLLSDDDSMKEAFKGCDCCFHCAAITDMWADPEITWKVNLVGTRKVLEAFREEGIRRLVHIGTASSFKFGTRENPGDETGGFSRVYEGTAYMESKHHAMKLVQDQVAGKGIDAVIVAPTFLLGAYDYRPSGGELIRQFLSRGLKYVSSGGRNFAYARDVAEAAALALEKGKTGESYIAGGENLDYLDFFGRVAQIAGVDPPRRTIPDALVKAAGAAGSLFAAITKKRAVITWKMARFSCYDTYYSSRKAIEELGMPRSPVEVAIEESIKSLREYGHI